VIGSKKFTRKVEDFICEHCKAEVKGNGYTNHCPKCLWSKHVDMNPGDRAEQCGGLMKPIKVVKEGKDYIVEQVCEKCKIHRRKRLVKEDDFGVAAEIQRKSL